MILLAQIIHRVFQLFTLVVIAQAILSYFMSPYDPIRSMIDRIVDPFLTPIRRFLPPVGMFDFSPLVLIILLQVLDSILFRLLVSLA
jgi:YggT family protein